MGLSYWRKYIFLVAFAAALAAQGAQAQGSTYSCDAGLYQIRQPNTNGGSNLYLLDRRNLSTGGTAQWSNLSNLALNALSYNKADGYFYAVNVTPLGTGSPYRLYRLGTTGAVEVVSLNGAGTPANAIPNLSTTAAGTVDKNGKMYIKLLQSDTTIYTIQLPTTPGGSIGAQGKITLSASIPMADMAFDPVTERLYGVYTANIPASNGATSTGVVYNIDSISGSVSTKGSGPTVSQTNAIGSAFFDVSGTLYAYQNGGAFGTINLTTGQFTRITGASAAQQSDGASCVFPDEKVTVSKASGSVEAISSTVYKVPYTITVNNTGNIPDRNIQLTENLAQTFSAGNPTLSITAGPTITSGTATPNAAFNGMSDTQLLSGINTLAAGASVTVGFTVQVTYPNPASVPTSATSNIVRASSTYTGPNEGYTFPGGTPLPPVDLLATSTSPGTPVNMVGQVDLAITKTGPATAVAGTSISYLLTLSNTGLSSANGATFSDAVPSILTGVTATCQNASTGVSGCAAAVGAGNTVTGSVGTFPTGSTVEIRITGLVPSAATGTLSNQASISAPGGTSDTSTANNISATVTTTLTQGANLVITKTDGKTTYVPGTVNTYTIKITNNGPSGANGAIFKDAAVSALTVNEDSDTPKGVVCSLPTGSAACPTVPNTTKSNMQTAGIVIPTLPSGGSVTFTVTGLVVLGTTGSLTNTATVTPHTGTGNSGTSCVSPAVFTVATGVCSISDTDTVVITPAVSLLKLGRNIGSATSPAPSAAFVDQNTVIAAKPGDTVEYCIVYKNDGGLAANFKLEDNVPGIMNALLDAYGATAPQKGLSWSAGTTTTAGATIAAGATARPAGTSLTSVGDADQGTLTSSGGTGSKGVMTLNLGGPGLPAGQRGTVCFQARVP